MLVAARVSDKARGETILAGADRVEHVHCPRRSRELSGEDALTSGDQHTVLVGELTGEERAQVRRSPQFEQHPRVTSGDELRIECVCGREVQHVGGIGWMQGTDDELGGPPEEWTAVSGQRLHHSQVRADQNEQHGSALQHRVPYLLQRSIQASIGLQEPRELIEHHDGRPLRGQSCGDHAQRRLPVRGRCIDEQFSTRKVRLSRHIRGEPVEIVARRPLPRGGGEEDRDAGVGAELGYQTGLTDLPPTANHEETALAVAPNVVQVSTEPRQLIPPANEADVTHVRDTNLRDTIKGSRRCATCGPTENVSTPGSVRHVVERCTPGQHD